MTHSDSLELMAVTTHTDGAEKLSMKKHCFGIKGKSEKHDKVL